MWSVDTSYLIPSRLGDSRRKIVACKLHLMIMGKAIESSAVGASGTPTPSLLAHLLPLSVTSSVDGHTVHGREQPQEIIGVLFLFPLQT